MKHALVLATSWMIGIPLTVLMLVSQQVSPPEMERLRFRKVYAGYKPSGTTPGMCDTAKMDEVRGPVTEQKSSVRINCNLMLEPGDKITRKLIFEGTAASGITLNCNGATIDGTGTRNAGGDMIEVRSKSSFEGNVRVWKRPENVTIKNCNIIGSVRVWGMAKNGEGLKYEDPDGEVNHYKKSSKSASHVATARRNAPKNIVFDHLTITGVGRNPVYFAPGVTYSKLINSEVKGASEKVAIYLDAESAYNTIENNEIHVTTAEDNWGELPFVASRGWPQVAIDGSSWNKIVNNRFSSLRNGGIYLYRNCGEDGVIRHNPPEHNSIINNIFYYKNYKGEKPAIYLSSRDYGFKERLGHCNDDDGYPFGSSSSEKDFARYNIVMQNQFYKRKIYKSNGGLTILADATLDDMIKTKNKPLNSPNYIDYNELVDVEKKRPTGCFIPSGYKKNFIVPGESIDLFKNSKGEPVCTGYKYTCNDGELTFAKSTACTISKVNFDCQVNGNNNGCSKVVGCPLGQRIIGAKAAANLEFGMVSTRELDEVPANRFKVVRPSDVIWSGSAYVGNNQLIAGEKAIKGINGLTKIKVGCKENDENGGDCHIKGVLYCYGAVNEIAEIDATEPRNNNQVEEVTAASTIGKAGILEPMVKEGVLAIHVFPNPTHQVFNMQIQGANSKDKIEVRVYDQAGRLVEVKSNFLEGQTIKIGDQYRPGLYIIKAIQGNATGTLKVVKH